MRPLRGRFKRVITSVAVVLAIVIAGTAVTATPASAHYFGLTKMDDSRVDFGSDEDVNDHFLFWNHFVHYQMTDQYDARTDLSGVEQCRHCWNDGTDIVWFAFPIPNASNGSRVLGDWSCRSFTLSGKCDRGRLRFNEGLTRAISGAAGFAITCHEIGHATGAEHYSDGGCMPASMNVNAPFTNVLSRHHIDHINSQY